VFGLAITGLIAGVTSWWMQPANQVQGPLRPGSFDVQGLLPPAYMLLAFAITVASGVLWRRTVPAVGMGIVAVVGIHLAVQAWLRPNFMTPFRICGHRDPLPMAPRIGWFREARVPAAMYM